MPKIYRVQSVSFPDERLLAAAQVKAKEQRRSLSNYVCGLIEDDLDWDVEKIDAAEARQLKGKRGGASSGATSQAAAVLAAAAGTTSGRTVKSRRK